MGLQRTAKVRRQRSGQPCPLGQHPWEGVRTGRCRAEGRGARKGPKASLVGCWGGPVLYFSKQWEEWEGGGARTSRENGEGGGEAFPQQGLALSLLLGGCLIPQHFPQETPREA